MKFRTEYIARKAGFGLTIDKPVVLLGSCFSDNIARRMRSCLWNACTPAGVLFNPLSIARVIDVMLGGGDVRRTAGESLFLHDNRFHSWLFDSSFSRLSPQEVIESVAEKSALFSATMAKADALFVTFGTAWCYFLNDSPDYVVTNCHKMPDKLFTRRRVGVTEIVSVWNQTLERLHASYPALNIIFTVSPVRHVRDDLHENQLSKATLQLAIDELCCAHNFCSYFPAYEILNDDLRDYRFYASDLAHPSDCAVEYIWEKFLETYANEEERKVLREGEAIARRAAHRPIIATEEEMRLFRLETSARLACFRAAHPAILEP